MNAVDLVVLALAALVAFRGWHRGALGQASELGGGFLGLVAGIALAPRLVGFFAETPGIQGALISLVVVFVFLSVGQTIGLLVGHRFGRMARRAQLGGVDQSLGVAFGIAITAVSFWLLGSLFVHGPTRPIAQAFQRSAVLQALNDAFEQPPDVFGYLRRYLDASGFPQVFAGFPRPVAPSVELPPPGRARRAVEAADQSTVRVTLAACGGTQLGSGFVVAPDRVVTNAHVVSGGDEVTVQTADGDREGEVVLYDPDLDLAVIRTFAPLPVPPLDLSTRALERGAPGAALGYPGARGGELIARRAAVKERFEAVGRDIYGREEVRRQVYELRARIRQGDSGGPFVTPSGEVAGVIFAASTTDPNTGYALTSAEVEDEIAAGLRSSAAVGTGPCAR